MIQQYDSHVVDTERYEAVSKRIRLRALEMALHAGAGHLGGSFSYADILVALYYGGLLQHDPADPTWADRDRLILSKGHANNTLYVILADRGYFPPQELDRFCQPGSFLGNHCDKMVPGVETISGSLGHGLGTAAGLAWGARLSGRDYRVFCILGDGESQEGSIWEAAMFAPQRRLGNLVAILDRNRLGSEDFTEDTAGLDPVEDKWAAFGWDVHSINGHDFRDIFTALGDVHSRDRQRPLMIVANTVKGRSIPALENTPRAHHTLPKGEQIEMARRVLV
ncbi:MAG: transketolase [Planctomycetota bacterium]|nr:transketolase [Planctomycetota bacterium]